MKLKIFYCLAAAALACAPLAAQQISESLVSTGRVLDVSNKTGTVILRSDQSAKALVFPGMQSAPVYFASGRRATFADIQQDQPATIYYTAGANQWLVGKIVIPNPPPPVTPAPALTASEIKALKSKAANDGDITTQPGVKARIDNDITTQPGSNNPGAGRNIPSTVR